MQCKSSLLENVFKMLVYLNISYQNVHSKEKEMTCLKITMVFLMNFKKKFEGFFSCLQSVKYEMSNYTTNRISIRSHKFRSSVSSSISLGTLREEQRVVFIYVDFLIRSWSLVKIPTRLNFLISRFSDVTRDHSIHFSLYYA